MNKRIRKLLSTLDKPKGYVEPLPPDTRRGKGQPKVRTDGAFTGEWPKPIKLRLTREDIMGQKGSASVPQDQ